jgi:hypothetical protein
MNAYYEHALSVDIKTSSGDKISLNFSKEQEASLEQQRSNNGSQTEFSYSSIQQFSFEYEGNGLDEQDLEEIEALMEIAMPRIENFMDEFDEDMRNPIPINSEGARIASIFDNVMQGGNQNLQNFAKHELVHGFDTIIQPHIQNKSLIQEGINFLENILSHMDEQFSALYA